MHPEHPLQQAWLRYKQTESYANTYRWITNEANQTILEGALRSAFMQGWDAHEWQGEQADKAKVAAMTVKEAHEWLNGKRSMTNLIPQDPLATWQVRIAEADAAMRQQAYWLLKAHNESLLMNKALAQVILTKREQERP